MQRFLQTLILLFSFFHFSLIFSQISSQYSRFDIPSFISSDKDFKASFIFKSDTLTSGLDLISVTKPEFIKIKSAVLKLDNKRIPLNVNFEKDNKNISNFQIDKLELPFENNKIYQIELTCVSSKQIKFNSKLFSLINTKEKVEDQISSISTNNVSSDEILVYEKQNLAGNCLNLTGNSKFEMDLRKSDGKKYFLEFWISTGDFVGEFFNIVSSFTNDEIISLSRNKFGYLSIPVNFDESERKDTYLGENNWNYIGLSLSNEFGKYIFDVYVNSNLVYSKTLDHSIENDITKFAFNNNNLNSSFKIDRLKLWEFKNSISLAEQNKHFLSYEADSSISIYQSNFDNKEPEFINADMINISQNNTIFIRSDAPIFSKVPKLNVTVGNSYNSIVWYVQELSVAKEFIVEKAYNNEQFVEVYTTYADNDPLKIYYFTDEIVKTNEVAFYRIKQINKDGSIVYSPEVKIGNKNIQEFNLGQNYPNPFNPITSIYVEVIIPTEMNVSVYDIVGNKVAQLHDGFLAEGMHTFKFDATKLPSGIYFYEVISPKSQVVKKMILAK